VRFAGRRPVALRAVAFFAGALRAPAFFAGTLAIVLSLPRCRDVVLAGTCFAEH
jgi:hypothetical protein